MVSRLETVTTRLREMILAGAFDPGARLLEIPLATRLGVSRTPLRLALGALEKAGLLERLRVSPTCLSQQREQANPAAGYEAAEWHSYRTGAPAGGGGLTVAVPWVWQGEYGGS